MNKRMDLRRIAAAAALVMALCGCTAAPAETTLPGEPPVTDTQIVETTGPVEISLAVGEYLINEKMLDESGVTNEDNGVKLFEDGTCMLYMGWGMWYAGPYAVEGGNLVCACDTMEWDGGGGPGSRDVEITFTFAIRGENLLELTEIVCADESELERVNPYAFALGLTYSIPEA